MANSDDFEYVDRALAEWDTFPIYKKDKYDYSKTKSDLGKQILDFLICLNNKKLQYSEKDYFVDEKAIISIVQKWPTGIYGIDKKRLEELKSKNELALYALKKYEHCVLDYYMIARETVNIIRRRLLEKRKI